MDFYYMRLIITVTPTAVVTGPAIRCRDTLVASALPRSQRMTSFRSGRRPGCRTTAPASSRPSTTRAGQPCCACSRRPTHSPAAGDGRARRGSALRPGAASLLCHSHDDKLASQNSFVVAGTSSTARWRVDPEHRPVRPRARYGRAAGHGDSNPRSAVHRRAVPGAARARASGGQVGGHRRTLADSSGDGRSAAGGVEQSRDPRGQQQGVQEHVLEVGARPAADPWQHHHRLLIGPGVQVGP